MIKDQKEFTEQIEKAIANIGRENAKTLSVQITTLVQEIQSGAGNNRNTFLLWNRKYLPTNLVSWVENQCQFAEWVLYIPDDADKMDLPIFAGLQKVHLDLPVGHLIAYCQPI